MVKRHQARIEAMRLRNFLFLILFTFSLTHQVLGARTGKETNACEGSEVDTVNLPDNRSQEDLEWCHSFAFADLISFYAKKKVSAFGIAAKSYQSIVLNRTLERPQATSWHTNPLAAFFFLVTEKRKLCLEENFQNMDNTAEKFSSVFRKLEEAMPDQQSRRCVDGYDSLISNIDETTLAVISKLSGGSYVSALINSKCISNAEIPEGSMTFWDRQTQKSIRCDNQPSSQNAATTEVSCPSESLRKEKDVPWSKLEQKLSKSEPVLVFYDARMLIKGATDPNSNFDHYSTIIGRRFNPKTQKCEYLLRNTWGTNCSQYPNHFDCTEGNIWIPGDVLSKNVKSVYSFDSSQDNLGSAKQ